MAHTIKFSKAEATRNAQTKLIHKEIIKLYDEVAKEQLQMIKVLERKGDLPARMQANELRKQIRRLSKQINLISEQLGDLITSGVGKVTDDVIRQNKSYLKSIGIRGAQLSIAFRNVPEEVVRSIISGKVYGQRDYLSKWLWKYNNDVIKRMETIISKGMLHSKSSVDIARDLEKFVRPSANKKAKTIHWVDKVGRSQRWYPGRVDYNALRFSRTMLQHGYQQSLHATLDENPFMKGYRWIANGSRVCPICEDRHGTIYKPDELPYDHPNGMCEFEVIMEDMDKQADRLAKWTNGTKDEALNEWIGTL